jgi:hypothetical protein
MTSPLPHPNQCDDEHREADGSSHEVFNIGLNC